jgi:hypothetical protein
VVFEPKKDGKYGDRQNNPPKGDDDKRTNEDKTPSEQQAENEEPDNKIDDFNVTFHTFTHSLILNAIASSPV